MKYIYPILSALGDSKWHFKEELYPIVLLTAGKKVKYLRSIKNIDRSFKKYLEYQLIKKGKSSNIKVKDVVLEVKGADCYQITEKGLAALDLYRTLSGAKDLSKGDLYGSDENFQNELKNFRKNKRMNKGD